jgi:hypothetical protein
MLAAACSRGARRLGSVAKMVVKVDVEYCGG